MALQALRRPFALGLLTLAIVGLTTAAWFSVYAGQAEEILYVDLNDGVPLPAVGVAKVTPLRLAVAAVISPQGTFESYSALANYLSEQLNRPVELVQRRTYAEVNDLIKNGEVDVAFVCTSAYVIGHREFGMSLLVAPQVNGRITYHSWLIVPAESMARNMADLRGKVFAFTDPWSTSGRIYPTSLVKALDESPETFFGRTLFTYSHDDAIRAVAKGVADGAAVDSLVYQYAVAREPELATQTKIIHRSPPFAIPPVVISTHLRPQVKADLERILLGMDGDLGGKAALAILDIDRFVLMDDADYDSVRLLEDGVGPLELR